MATTLIKKIKFGNAVNDALEVYSGTTIPEGVNYSPNGSIYIYTGVGIPATVFQKRTASTVNTGWVNLTAAATTTSNGSVKQMALIPNSTATDIAGVNSKIDTILTELKNKGIMSNI